MPTVSVIIPVYDRAHTVRRALESVFTQASPSWSMEIIVVDDHSSDDLAGALAGYRGRLNCICHSQNCGAAAARNTGIAAAKGDYVAFLDSDDVWCPGKLSAQLAAMTSRGWRASCTAYYLAWPRRQPIVSPRYPTGALNFDDMVWGCMVSPGSTLVCERTLFEDVGCFDTTMRRLEDWDWLLRYTRRHPLGFLAQPLALVEPSRTSNFANLADAIDAIRGRYVSTMVGANRRHFASALDVHSASVEYGRGNVLLAALMLLKALGRAPFHNAALAAILHNRLSRA